MPRTGDTTRIRAVYGKPLVKRAAEDDEIEDLKGLALELVGEEAVEQIRKEIRESSWKSSPQALLDSFEWDVKGSQMIIKSDHPAAQYIDKGVEAYQMTHLTKAKKPIPIITDEGNLIFRWATEQSMDNGKWFHPGIKGKNFIDRGVRQARQKVKNEVKEFVKEDIRERYKEIAKKAGQKRMGREIWEDL